MKIKIAKIIAPDGTPRFSASHLGLFCLPMSHKRDARLIWVNSNSKITPYLDLFRLQNNVNYFSTYGLYVSNWLVSPERFLSYMVLNSGACSKSLRNFISNNLSSIKYSCTVKPNRMLFDVAGLKIL